MRRGLAVLILAAACSGASSSSGASGGAVADHRGDKPAPLARRHTHAMLPPIGGIDEHPVAACPPAADLAGRLRDLWELPAAARLDIATCARGHFGRPGWLIDAFIATGDAGSEERIEVLAADDSGVIAILDPDGVRTADRADLGAGDSWQAADLDGDGMDELLEVQELFQTGVRSTALAVYRIEGTAIREVSRLPLAFDNQNAKAITAPRIVTCSGQQSLADGGNRTREVLVEGTIARSGRRAEGTIRASCPLPGSHRYRLIGGKLEEVTP